MKIDEKGNEGNKNGRRMYTKRRMKRHKEEEICTKKDKQKKLQEEVQTYSKKN